MSSLAPDAGDRRELVPEADPGVGELWPRYEPGEELGPLLRGFGGGVIGGLLALTVDWIIAAAASAPWVWPTVASSAAGQSGDVRTGAILVLAGGVAAALVFVFGEFRRFVPGSGVVAGAVYGLIVWLVAAPLLLPYWPVLARATDDPVAVLVLASLAVGQSFLALVAFGVVVGWMNPHDRVEPPAA